VILMLTLRKEFHYEVEISATLVDGRVIYSPQIVEGMLSHFDHHANYSGSSVEEAVTKIALGIESALEMLHSM
jgi:hypothetical protein